MPKMVWRLFWMASTGTVIYLVFAIPIGIILYAAAGSLVGSILVIGPLLFLQYPVYRTLAAHRPAASEANHDVAGR